MKVNDLITTQGLTRFIPQTVKANPRRRKLINRPIEKPKPKTKK